MSTKPIADKLLPLWWIKLTRFEFWPFWVFYFPMLFYGLWLAVKNRSLTYYTAVNPGMNAGGIAGEGKLNLLSKIDPKFVPATLLVNALQDFDSIDILLDNHGIEFPCIVKPNGSERGIGVEIIHSTKELNEYFEKRQGDYLIQELIHAPIELGILYHRFPNGNSGITSIVRKEFLRISGDDKHTIEQLIRDSTRARFRLDYLLNKFQGRLHEILSSGQTLLLEPIGNHNRGTAFLNANELITTELISIFNEITGSLEGFNYGRFDLKVSSLADLLNGEGIRILEVNGVESEPAHIYDPEMSLFKAYTDVAKHMRLISEIARANKRTGIRTLPFRNFIFVVRQHLRQRSQYAVS